MESLTYYVHLYILVFTSFFSAGDKFDKNF